MNINYWNMKNYIPLFSCDSEEFERLHKDIGNKAAIEIQTNFRKYIDRKYPGRKISIEIRTNFNKYIERNAPHGIYGKKTKTRPNSPGLRWGERN